MADLADEILDTVREALLILDDKLEVISANRSFYRTFGVTPPETIGRRIYDLGNGQWDVPALRTLLERIVPDQTTVESYEVSHEFPNLGQRTMLLNARRLRRSAGKSSRMLLAIEDVTERHAAEIAQEQLNQRVQDAARESAHRIKNSFMLLTSFVRLQERASSLEETRRALRAVGARVDAVARLYERLSHHAGIDNVLPVRPYLYSLCADLNRSIIEGTGLELECHSDELNLAADRIVALGLAVNELVMNAVKHGFGDRKRGSINVLVTAVNHQIRLSVTDDGVGTATDAATDSGLGTIFLKSFVEQLEVRWR